MARKRKGRPSWFKMTLAMKPIICSLDAADVGRGLQLAMDYFKSGVYPEENETPMALVVFSMLKGEADNSLNAYNYVVEKAQQERDDAQQAENNYESINESTLP